MSEVERRFARAGVAPRWDRLYREETELLEDVNYRLRRDDVVARVVAAVRPGGRVLDLGCGAGPVITELRARGIDCVGADYSPDMLQYARERLAGHGLSTTDLIQCDCRSTPFQAEQFDVIACVGVISYLEDYRPVLQEIHRILAPGGTAIITFRNRLNLTLSDPVRLAKELVKIIFRRSRAEPFKIGRFLDFREVHAAALAAGFTYVTMHGIGFGPLRFAGCELLAQKASIRISSWLTRLFAALGLQAPFKWATDISIWVYQKPQG